MRSLRGLLALLCAAAVAIVSLSVAAAPPAAVSTGGPFSGTVTFNFSGAVQQWTIPSSVTQLQVASVGAGGSAGGDYGAFTSGTAGLGEKVVTTAPVGGSSEFQPGAVANVIVGGAGNQPQGPAYLDGGGGGGAGGGGSGSGAEGGSYDYTGNLIADSSGAQSSTGSVTIVYSGVVLVTPAVTSGSGTTFVKGKKGTFRMKATGFPAPTFSKVGTVPAGVILTTAGVLSGTARATGSFRITFKATKVWERPPPGRSPSRSS